MSPLLPLSHNANVTDSNPLSTAPRPRDVIDSDAQLQFHTRQPKRAGEPHPPSDDLYPKRTRLLLLFALEHDEPFSQQVPPLLPPRLDDSGLECDTTLTMLQPPETTQPTPADTTQLVPALEGDRWINWDRYGRFKVLPTTDEPLDVEPGMYDPENALERARVLIDNSVFDSPVDINLDLYGLQQLPDNIGDLANVMTGTSVHINLAHNPLTRLPPALFAIGRHLTVLLLRLTQIRTLPGAIDQLICLQYLLLAGARLTHLPHNVLALQRLETLTIRPNPLVPIPAHALPVPATTSRYTLTHVLRLKWVMAHRSTSLLVENPEPPVLEGVPNHVSAVPRLAEWCTRSIAKVEPSPRDALEWRHALDHHHRQRVLRAYAAAHSRQTCGECGRLCVDPVAEVYEWWDMLSQPGVPVKRIFCCGGCGYRYNQRVVVPCLPPTSLAGA